jgi:hypothetical protein
MDSLAKEKECVLIISCERVINSEGGWNSLLARRFCQHRQRTAMTVNPMYTAMTMKQLPEAMSICSCVGEPRPSSGLNHSPTYLCDVATERLTPHIEEGAKSTSHSRYRS